MTDRAQLIVRLRHWPAEWMAYLRSRRFRHILEYIGFRIFYGLLKAIPLELCAPLLARGCRAFSSRSFRHRRALANLEKAFPEKSLEQRDAIALAMWDNVGRVLAEAVHLDRFLAEPHRLDMLEMSILDGYKTEHGLYIAVSLHTGNWELGLLPSALRGYDPAAIYRVVANPLVDRFIRASRAKIYSGGLFAMRDSSGGLTPVESASRELVRCLRRGGVVGIVADYHDPKGIEIPFLGQTIRVSKVPATLAYQFKGRICVARAVRLGHSSRFLADAHALKLPQTGDRHADIEALTLAIFHQFEAWIRQFPEQWLWSQAPFVLSSEVARS